MYSHLVLRDFALLGVAGFYQAGRFTDNAYPASLPWLASLGAFASEPLVNLEDTEPRIEAEGTDCDWEHTSITFCKYGLLGHLSEAGSLQNPYPWPLWPEDNHLNTLVKFWAAVKGISLTQQLAQFRE